MKISNLILKRVIFEVRYDPVLSYLKLREEVFNPWVKEFTSVKMSNITLELINKDLAFKVFSELNRSGLYFENVKDIDKSKELMSKYLPQIIKSYNRTELRRIGSRYYYVLPYKGAFKDLFKIIKQNIYKDPIDSFGEIVDLGVFALIVKDGNYKININVGPVKKQEITDGNEFKCDDDPETSISLDIDVYCDIRLEYKIKDFLEEAYDCARVKCIKFLESIKEKE